MDVLSEVMEWDLSDLAQPRACQDFPPLEVSSAGIRRSAPR